MAPPAVRPAPLPVGPGQRSVWDFPRPPVVERDDRLVVVELGGTQVCRTTGALLVLETSHPPGWYLPEPAFAPGVLEAADGSSSCEWKGVAGYLSLIGGGVRADRAAWTYRSPAPAYDVLRGHVALYPAAVDRCTVAGEVVLPQEGGFYGGWVTTDVLGPFKGGLGSTWW